MSSNEPGVNCPAVEWLSWPEVVRDVLSLSAKSVQLLVVAGGEVMGHGEGPEATHELGWHVHGIGKHCPRDYLIAPWSSE